jgi:PAS domain S-box-containing protein
MIRPSILIVEDEAIVAADLAVKLERFGYDVAGTVGSGEEAVELARERHPSLVLLDIRLAGQMDGIAAARAIQRDRDTPVVFLTAHSDTTTINRAKGADPFAYLIKPFEDQELKTTIEIALHKHQADLQVRRHREWLRVTLTSVADGVITCDNDGQITFLNPIAEKLTGWLTAEALGQSLHNVFRLIDEQSRQPYDKFVAEVLQQRCTVSPVNHTLLVTRDAREIPIEKTAAPIVEADDSICGVVVVFQDVTEKRQTQRLIQTERDFVSAILDTAGALVLVLDVEGRIQRFNRTCEQLSGYRFEEVQGRRFWEFLLSEDEAQEVKSTFAQLCSGHFPVSRENDWVTKEGGRRRISWSNTCILDPAGKVQFIVSSGIDVTEQRQMEKALRKTAELQRLALESGKLGAWDYNFSTGEIYWDEYCRDLFGASKGGQFIYEQAMNLIHEEDRPVVDRAVQAALAPDSSGTYEREFRVTRPDGTVRWLAGKGQAIFQGENGGRKAVRFVGVTQDVTERKLAEDTLRFLADCSRGGAGEDFFKSLTRYIAQTLNMDIVCVDRLEDNLEVAQTVALYADGKFGDDISYSLKGSPCAAALGQTVCCFPKDLRRLFPQDTLLEELKAESYIGVTLWNVQRQPIGLVVALSHKPMVNPEVAGSLLKLVAVSAARELERRQAEESLRRANEMLEQRVVERTADLHRANLTLHAEIAVRTEAERNRRVSEERYRSLVTASAQIIWTANPQGEFEEDSPTWRMFTGQSVDQIKGAGWLDAVHPEDRDHARVFWSKHEPSRGLREIEYRLLGADGTYGIFSVRAVPILDADQNVHEWVGACTNITERKAEEKRRTVTHALLDLFAHKTTSRDYLDSVVQFLRDWTGAQALGVRILDREANAPYEASIGFEPEFLEIESQLSTKTDSCLCLRALCEKLENQEHNLLTHQGSFHCDNYSEFVNRLTPDQQSKYRRICPKYGFVSVAIIPLRYREKTLGAIHLADPRPGWFVPSVVNFLEAMSPLIAEAITRFQAEAELSLHRDHLAELVQQRTAELELANARLQNEVAERTEAQAALARSQGLLEAIFNSMTDSVVFMDPTLQICSTNPAARESLGYVSLELEGQSGEVLYARKSDFNKLCQTRLRQEAKPSRAPAELWYERKDGTRFLGDSVVNPVRDPQGVLLGFLDIHRDITERKRAERNLAWLASFPELSPDPVVEIDLSTKTIAYVNPSSRRLFPDLDLKGLAHPWLAGIQPSIEASRVSGTPCVGREVQVGDSWFAQSFCFVPGRQRLRIYSLDITERKLAEEAVRRARDELGVRVEERTIELKQAVERLRTEVLVHQQTEQALAESEARYHKLFEFAPVGIGVADFDGNILGFNRNLCGLMGMTPEEAQATKLPSLYEHPADLERMLPRLRRAGSIRNWEVRKKRKDGSVFTALMHMQQIQIGPKPAVLVILEDITKQNQISRHTQGVRMLLELFATRQTGPEYLTSVVNLLQEWCGCAGVGIRLLQEDGRLPYTAQVGFTPEFIESEEALCLQNADCGCIRRLRGEPSRQEALSLNSNGTFTCNNLRECERLATGTNSCGTQAACLLAHYGSIASVAIRYHGELLGALQLADPQEERFPAHVIEFIETVAPLIGEAIHRFKVERSLFDSEQRFRSMFEGHSAVLLLINPLSGEIVDANPAAATFYGYSQEQLKHLKIEQLNTLPQEAMVAKRLRVLEGKLNVFISVHRLSSGELRTVEVHSSPVPVGGQELLFSIIHDISERMMLQKQVLAIAEEERQRVGRDLHDSLGGNLAGAALLGKALANTLRTRSIPEASLADEVVQCLNQSISHTRAIAHGLCPVELSGAGFDAALAEFAADISRRAGVSCQWCADARTDVRDVIVASHLFLIVQESVQNAIRHGQANNITIDLTNMGDHVSLKISDDGSGLPKELGPGKGIGLRTMKYRADIIGAELTVRRGEKGGTVVTCLVPSAKMSVTKQAEPCL